MNSFRNLRTLLSLSFAALTIISTIVLSVVITRHFSSGIEQGIGRSLGQLAEQMQSQLAAGMAARQKDIQIAASLEEFRDKGASSERHLRLDMLQRSYPVFAWIGFADNNGIVMEATNRLLEGVSVAERPWFAKAQHGPISIDVHQAKLLAALLPNPSKEPLRFVDVASPVFDATGTKIGVLGAHLSWSWTRDMENQLLEPLRRFQHVDMFVLSREGEVLLGPESYLGTKLKLPRFDASDRAGNGYRVEKWPDGKQYLTGYAESRGHESFDGLGWTVLVRQDLQEAYAPVYSAQRKVWGWGALLGILFVGLGLLIARRIAKPLLAISDAADRIRTGQASTEIPLSSAYKEVHRLSYSLRSLLVNRLRAEQELKDVNQSLEARVAERTAELSASEARTRAIVTRLSDGIVTLDGHGSIQNVNPAFCNLFGYAEETLLGNSVNLVLPDLHIDARHGFVCYLDHGEILNNDKQSIELRGTRKDGSLIEVELAMTAPSTEDESQFICVVRDITQRKQTESHQAAHDVVTGLMNRREFERNLALLLEGELEPLADHALLYLDLDQFKVVNDVCGHLAGDDLLRQVTAELNAQLSGADILARLGGDEFAVLLKHCSMERALQCAELIRSGLSNQGFKCRDKSFRVTVSIGLVLFNKSTYTLADVLSAADAACYVAKDQGRNRIHVFQSDEAQLARRRSDMGWISRIHDALEENRFCLYAQQISPVSNTSGQEGHYEILVRMIDEEQKLVPPFAFIPAAERYGLMPAIDSWVIEHAFRFVAQANSRQHTRVNLAINLSGASLNEDKTIDFIRAQRALHDVRPENICFEVTETAAIANLAKANAFIQALKADGFKFSLDDFGSGMSSFAYLKNLPVDYLKIDGCFVRDMVTDHVDCAMVGAIHRIGQVMNIQTIAEFVENEEILNRLKEIGVNFAQGYGIAKPCPIEHILEEQTR